MVIGERRKQECELLLESADRKQKLGVLAQSSYCNLSGGGGTGDQSYG